MGCCARAAVASQSATTAANIITSVSFIGVCFMGKLAFLVKLSSYDYDRQISKDMPRVSLRGTKGMITQWLNGGYDVLNILKNDKIVSAMGQI